MRVLRRIPPFEFENWAVIALVGIPNKTQVGDRGIDGCIYPASAALDRRGKVKGKFDSTDIRYPIQVKQRDKTGSPDIRDFEGVMTTHERTKGFFISFDYSTDALQEIDHFFRKTGKVIVPLTVREILDEQIARKLA